MLRLTDIWLRLALALLIGAGLAACAGDSALDGAEEPQPPRQEELASFTVRVAPADDPASRVSRAGSDVVAPLETMQTLRVVILSEGRVEVNSLAVLGENAH